MRHLLTRLAAAAFVAGLALASGPAQPRRCPKVDGLASQTSAVEDVGYRYHRRGYRPGHRYGYYGYRYRPYYGYGYRLLSPLLPAVLPALLALLVVGGRTSIRGSAGFAAGPRFRPEQSGTRK